MPSRAWDDELLGGPNTAPDKAARVEAMFEAMFEAIAPTYQRVNTLASLGQVAG